MNTRHGGFLRIGIAAAAMLLGAGATAQMQMANHLIDGITGPAFTLTAKAAYLSTPEGNSIYFWGYAGGDGPAQYCGPTLIVNQGQAVTVTLRNELPVPTSIVFPGHTGVTAAGGSPGLLTREAPAPAGGTAGTVTYSFTASRPGTFLYNSGTRPDLQIEMGLVGALIVRPAGFNPMMPATWRAYTTGDTAFDQEFLFLLTDMDDTIHSEVELQVLIGGPIVADTAAYFPVYWFMNGRAGPDTMAPAGAAYLPHQPYDCMPMMRPGEKLLMRVIGAGRDPHPLHHHGNNALVIARDGSPLRAPSGPGGGAGADLAYSVFTIPATPGGTTDAIFTWTGRGLGWDIYGHAPGDPLAPYEDPEDHGKPFPAVLPTLQDMTFGQMYSGSPFLGTLGSLPPGEGGFNASAGFMYMWHSHAEKEIVNNDIFPGGMMTMLMIEPWHMMP
ncbi:MAG TPA: hypothetical protein DCM87_10565 [Planctomycetes bacterium]|nr:hypothetical protein [Planctomycetota bacterium]